MELGWPASIPFTDGNVIGALLQKWFASLSLYPAKMGLPVWLLKWCFRYKNKDVAWHRTGKNFLVDMNEGRIIEDDELEIKDAIVTSNNYLKWLDEVIHLAKPTI
jgi:glutamate synthase (ferredoxin)